MIVIRIKMQVTPENRASFLEAMQGSIPVAKTFEGCIDFSFYQDVADENALLLYEEWETLAHFDAYRTSEHFKEIGQVLFPLMDGTPRSVYYEANAIQ